MSDSLNKIKIHIVFEFSDEPTGGGNQFLKSLKNLLKVQGVYEESAPDSEIILFNSHQQITGVAKLKLRCPDKFFVHRIDGPMQLYNKTSDKRDDIVAAGNKYLADATIFQSQWSQQQKRMLGLHPKELETVICNAPDASIFNRKDKAEFSTERKVRLVATSWSKNWKKGFEVYRWLDEHLDFEKYEMTFIGNSPVNFKNIKHIAPLKSKHLAKELISNDIFITASQKDPCSNSLIEALHCGLPVIALKDGGHPEIVNKGGEVFIRPNDIPVLLEKIVNNYKSYQANINNPSIEDIGKKYYDFILNSHDRFRLREQKHGSFGWLDYVKFRMLISYYRLAGRLYRITEGS